MPTFTYEVDAEEYTTDQHELTPRKILEKAGLSPAIYYLELHDGNHTESLQAKMDMPLHMHDRMTFTSIKMGPTPLSGHTGHHRGTPHVS